MPKWTQQQQLAIDDRGHSMIVCAAAGSGKTAVLAQRIAGMVRDGESVESMLVVTFTRAAASEMRERIGRTLREMLAQTRDTASRKRLLREIYALPAANICTLHSFCGKIARRYFQLTGADPSARVADEQESRVLKTQTLEEALFDGLESQGKSILAADSVFTQSEILKHAREIREFLMTRPDPGRTMNLSLERAQNGMKTVEEVAGRYLAEEAALCIGVLLQDARKRVQMCQTAGGPLHYLEAMSSDVKLLEEALEAAGQGYGAMKAYFDTLSYSSKKVSLKGLGRPKKKDEYDRELAERIKQERETVRDELYKIGQSWLSASAEDAAADLQMTEKPLEGLMDLVNLWETLYSREKAHRGILDYEDLEHMALKALRHAEVQRALAREFRWVFIDEYQDSSMIQEEIVNRFANLGRTDALFHVGDIKQSIYRFRQADPLLFRQKAIEYGMEKREDARRVNLQMNFRSEKNVLESVNAVFEKIMHTWLAELEYDSQERLYCGLEGTDSGIPTLMHVIRGKSGDGPEEGGGEESAEGEESEERELDCAEWEAAFAAKKIQEMMGREIYDAKAGCMRPLEERDFVILQRSVNRVAARMAEMLREKGIRAECETGSAFLDAYEIRQMIAILQVIDNQADDLALLALLNGPAGGCSGEDLAQIRLATRELRIPFAQAFEVYQQKENDLALRLRSIGEQIGQWREYAQFHPVYQLMEKICQDTLMYSRVGALPGGRGRTAMLRQLVTMAKEFSTNQGTSLHAFLQYLHRIEKAGGTGPLSTREIGGRSNAVRIMSIHKSKGLEFPVVIITGMGNRFKTDKTDEVLCDADLGIAIPVVDRELSSCRVSLLQRAILVKKRKEAVAEEMRILYVAMTRARNALILVGSSRYKKRDDKKWKKGCSGSALMNLCTELDMVCPVLCEAGWDLQEEEPREIRVGQSDWIVEIQPREKKMKTPDQKEERLRKLRERLEEIPFDVELAREMMWDEAQQVRERKVSVSSIVRDLRVQRMRWKGEIIRYPRYMTENEPTNVEIGSAFHRAVSLLSLSSLRESRDLEGEIAAQLERMKEKNILRPAESRALRLSMFTDLMASPLGVRMMKSPEVRREWQFFLRRPERTESVLVQGVIDCCFMEDGEWVLVDYKTDSPEDPEKIVDTYRPQLEMYERALREITGRKVREKVLYLVRSGQICRL